MVHEGQHLQSEHVLSEVIAMFSYHLDGSSCVHRCGVHVLELQP